MDWNLANAFKIYKDIDSKLVMDLAVSNLEWVENGLGASDKGNYQMLDIVCWEIYGCSNQKIRGHITGSKMLLGISEKKVASIIYSYLESFYKTTNDMCTSKFPTIGLILFFMDHISDTITAYKDSRQCPDWLKRPLEVMSRKSRDCNLFTFMTAILDPRIKVELLPEVLDAENNFEEARNHFVRYYSSSHFSSMSSAYIHNPVEVEDRECLIGRGNCTKETQSKHAHIH